MNNAKRNTKPILCITMGDFNGIGPEVVLKALTKNFIWDICFPVLVGSIDVFEWYARQMQIPVLLREVSHHPTKFEKKVIPVINTHPFRLPKIRVGTLSREAGTYAVEAIVKAVKLCKQKLADGIVTAPVSKAAMAAAGCRYAGQTEMLKRRTGGKKVVMMLVANNFRVGLVTVHVPVKNVSKIIAKNKIVDAISVVNRALKEDFAIVRPSIAVLGLNPHAGENGMLGVEEKRHIIPALQKVNAMNIRAEGPFAADGFFGSHNYRNYDAVLAMYHDQGLIPLKIVGFDIGVNFSAGLPIVRTSPSHGTAYEIAGKGIANPSSTIEAIKLAVSIIKNRKG